MEKKKLIIPGIVSLIGVILLVVGVYGAAVNLHKYLFKHDLYIIGLFLSPVLTVVGVGFVYAGTKYLDRAKSFMENAWLVGVTMIGLGIFVLFYDTVFNILFYDILGLILDISLIAIGSLFVWASRKESKVQINTGD